MSYTDEQQKSHRLQLADYLETVPDKNYDHSLFIFKDKHCALGHAAVQGIGGMQFDDLFGLPTYLNHRTKESADMVFGDDSYATIFDCGEHDVSRLEAIKALRDFF